MGEHNIVLKCHYHKEIRIIKVPASITYAALLEQLRQEFGTSVSIFYEDEERDVITIRSQDGLRSAFEEHVRHRAENTNVHNFKLYLHNEQESATLPDATADSGSSATLSPNAAAKAAPGWQWKNARKEANLMVQIVKEDETRQTRKLSMEEHDAHEHDEPLVEEISSGSSDPARVAHGRLPMVLSNGVQLLKADKLKWTKSQDIVGAGSFGRVFLGLTTGGQLIAVKEVQYSETARMDKLKELEREIWIMQKLSHPHIVQYLGAEMVDSTIFILMEYISGGSIATLLNKFGRFAEGLTRVYTRQILQGLAYLHNNNIIHRDIKGANILVDTNGVVKLADFGASTILAGVDQTKSLKGTPYFMAPEVIKQQSYNTSADIWSLAGTVLEMVSGAPPWSNYGRFETVLYKICSSDEPPTYPADLSPVGRDFLNKCFQRDPSKRPTAEELLLHPFVCGADLPGSPSREPAPHLAEDDSTSLSASSAPTTPHSSSHPGGTLYRNREHSASTPEHMGSPAESLQTPRADTPMTPPPFPRSVSLDAMPAPAKTTPEPPPSAPSTPARSTVTEEKSNGSWSPLSLVSWLLGGNQSTPSSNPSAKTTPTSKPTAGAMVTRPVPNNECVHDAQAVTHYLKHRVKEAAVAMKEIFQELEHSVVDEIHNSPSLSHHHQHQTSSGFKHSRSRAIAPLAAVVPEFDIVPIQPGMWPRARFTCVLDVKPESEDTDLGQLERAVRLIDIPGLTWGFSAWEPLAFSLKKLRISCVFINDLVSVGDIEDSIMAFSEYVQSVEVVAVNKIAAAVDGGSAFGGGSHVAPPTVPPMGSMGSMGSVGGTSSMVETQPRQPTPRTPVFPHTGVAVVAQAPGTGGSEDLFSFN